MKINQTAPVIQSKEILIEAPAEIVWTVLTTIDHWSKWNNRISSSQLQGNLNEGTIFIWKSNGSKISSTIHTIEPFIKFGWSGEVLGIKAIHNWHFEQTAKGTKITVEESMEGWLMHLMKRKMNKKLAEDMLHWLECLKRESENRVFA